MSRLRFALAAASLAMSACASGSGAFVDPFPDATQIAVPDTVGELTASLEDEATGELTSTGDEETYVDEGWVYTLRLNEELKALFEVVRLTDEARPADLDFRRNLIGQISGSLEQRPERIGGTLVYRGTQGEQTMFVWFEGRFLQVLMVRTEETIQGEGRGFDLRSLLRNVIELEPA